MLRNAFYDLACKTDLYWLVHDAFMYPFPWLASQC